MDYKDLNDYEVVYMVKENDDDAREIIFNKYIPIVKKIASNYLAYAKLARIEYDDLVQEGLIALNVAINRYNGFSYKEISSLLDIPITIIDGRLYKIRKTLQNKIKNAF